MKTRLLVASIVAVALAASTVNECLGDAIPHGAYFGQRPPGATPKVFAPGILSLADRYEYSLAFSPDLTECVFGVTDSSWSTFTLFYTKMAADSSWSDPIRAPFLGDGDGLSPAYAHDGQSIYFASSRPSYPPANLWQARRNASGGWDEPVMIHAPVSTSADEFAPSITVAGVLYFVSSRSGGTGDADIYRATPERGVFVSVENLGAPINSKHLESTPFVAPDETYIIFESDRPGGFGQQDLYVSHRSDGVWSAPKNLGPGINTSQIEDEAYVSPDGRFLFFNRRAAYVTRQPTDLHWVEMGAIVDGKDLHAPGGGTPDRR